MSRPAALGRGLEVLLGGAAPASELAQLPVGSVVPNTRQPRREFDAEAIETLAESIRAQGVVQPVVARPLARDELVSTVAERRWRAARKAGLATIPALVREADDRASLLIALVENVAREDLSALEEARAYAVLQDEFGLSLGEVAERVGRSKPSVSNRLRLLDLPDDVLELLARGDLSEGHARAVLAVQGNEERRRLAEQIVRRGLSVRAAEAAARQAGARTKTRRSAPVDPELALRARDAFARFGISSARVTATRIELPFADETELAELLEALERAA
jgi:ParB family transcriptional regulator, chromosome partitioning protein